MTTSRQRGFTVLELMITIAVLAVLLGVAVPSFLSVIQNNRITSETNELVTALQLARSEAVKRSATVSVCAADTSVESPSCGNDWTSGWMVITGKPGETGEILRRWPVPNSETSITVTPTSSSVTFIDSGRSESAVSYSLSISNCVGDQVRDVEVGPTGRVSVTRKACT